MNASIALARGFAIGAHGDQKYGSGAPYYKHLDDVVAVLRRYNVTAMGLLQAGYLHDVLEDTKATPEQIKSLFGADVLAVVQAVTNEPGANRKERHLKTYPKIRKAGDWALILKLADRIANVEASLADTAGGKIGMYRKEHDSFKEALYSDGQTNLIKEMWKRLDWMLSTKTDKMVVYVLLDLNHSVISVHRKLADAEAIEATHFGSFTVGPFDVD